MSSENWQFWQGEDFESHSFGLDPSDQRLFGWGWVSGVRETGTTCMFHGCPDSCLTLFLYILVWCQQVPTHQPSAIGAKMMAHNPRSLLHVCGVQPSQGFGSVECHHWRCVCKKAKTLKDSSHERLDGFWIHKYSSDSP